MNNDDDKARWDRLYKTSAEDAEDTFQWFVDKGHPPAVAIGLTVAAFLDKWLSEIEMNVGEQ